MPHVLSSRDQGWELDPRVTHQWWPMIGWRGSKRWARLNASYQGNLELRLDRWGQLALDNNTENVATERGQRLSVRWPYSEVESRSEKWRAEVQRENMQNIRRLKDRCLSSSQLVCSHESWLHSRSWSRPLFFATKRPSSKAAAISIKQLLKCQELEARFIFLCPSLARGIPRLELFLRGPIFSKALIHMCSFSDLPKDFQILHVPLLWLVPVSPLGTARIDCSARWASGHQPQNCTLFDFLMTELSCWLTRKYASHLTRNPPRVIAVTKCQCRKGPGGHRAQPCHFSNEVTASQRGYRTCPRSGKVE